MFSLFFFFLGGVFLISTVPLQSPSGWAEAGEPTVVKPCSRFRISKVSG